MPFKSPANTYLIQLMYLTNQLETEDIVTLK